MLAQGDDLTITLAKLLSIQSTNFTGEGHNLLQSG